MQEKINDDIVGFPEEGGSRHHRAKTTLDNSRLSYIATGVVVVPAMLIAATVPNSFSIATDIAVSVHRIIGYPSILGPQLGKY